MELLHWHRSTSEATEDSVRFGTSKMFLPRCCTTSFRVQGTQISDGFVIQRLTAPFPIPNKAMTTYLHWQCTLFPLGFDRCSDGALGHGFETQRL